MIDIKHVKPLWNQIITTAYKFDKEELVDENGLILNNAITKGAYREYQKVLAVSDMVERQGNIKVGDWVMIDPTKYLKQAWYERNKDSLRDIDPSVHKVSFTLHAEFPVIKFREHALNLTYGDYTGECMRIYDNDIEYIMDDFKLE